MINCVGFQITAKRDGQPDDLCISFLLSLYWSFYVAVQHAIEQEEREEQAERERYEGAVRRQQQQQQTASVNTRRSRAERPAYAWENTY